MGPQDAPTTILSKGHESSAYFPTAIPTMVHSLGSLAAIFLAVLTSVSSAAKNPKRGLAFAESDHSGDIKLASASSSVVSWVYDWGQSPKDYIASSGIPYVPMQWGTDNIQNFASLVKQQGAKTILVSLLPNIADPCTQGY